MIHTTPDAFAPIVRKEAEEAEADDVVTKALAALTEQVEKRVAAAEAKADNSALLARLDKLEAKAARPGGQSTGADATAEERKAFELFLRRGAERMDPAEVKALTVATDANGGFLAPEEFGNELIKLLTEFSPIRQYARVITIGAAEVKYPRRVTGTAATWTDETADRTPSQPAYEQIKLTPHELATYVDVSTALLEDNAYGLESELMADFAEAFAIAEGQAFVSGTGVGQPKGIMQATGIATIGTGDADGFPAANPADVLIRMFHALPTAHAAKGVWVMNRSTLGAIREWKDGQGRYLVADPISATAASTILGRPIAEMADMDDIGAGAFPVLFGDLSGYRIADRVSLTTLRDPFTLATKGQVRMHARKRVGADVTHPDRFIKLEVAA